jgi:SAM-dependent methyltransferase
MPHDILLELAPLHPDPVDLGKANGTRIWRASSIDPAFAATVPIGVGAIEAGWYRASAVLDCRSGDVREPRLYVPDTAGHFSEAGSVPMVRDGAAYQADFYLPRPSSFLRFDPSVTPCEFACDALTVASIGRPWRGMLGFLQWPGVEQLGMRVRSIRDHLRKSARKQAAAARTAGRRARVLATIDRKGEGIEIGPSHDPIAPKSEGFNVEVIDHASRAELLVKYADHPVELDRIEEVDHVWKGQSYVELTGKPRHYDWIIASHLIEHTPDLIAFLEDCDSILKDAGVLSLVVPDKRYVFDRFRPITGLGRIIDAHLAGAKIPSAGAVAEYYMNVAGKAHQLGWSEGTVGDYTFIHSARDATDKMSEVGTGAYVDIHNWCFVPHSFRLLMHDLYVLGYTKLREVSFHPTEGCEFYVALGRHGTGANLSRLEILRAIDAELAATDAE